MMAWQHTQTAGHYRLEKLQKHKIKLRAATQAGILAFMNKNYFISTSSTS